MYYFTELTANQLLHTYIYATLYHILFNSDDQALQNVQYKDVTRTLKYMSYIKNYLVICRVIVHNGF